MTPARIAAIVLAAGEASRMGRPKLALAYRGGTVLSAVLAPLLEAPLDGIVVVLGHAAEEVRRAAGSASDPRLRFVTNEAWREGMASSLRCGLGACAEADAVLVALGDKVGATTELIRRIIGAASASPLVVPLVNSRASHPVLFSRVLFGELQALEGDVGAREVVRRHAAEAAFVEGLPLHDVDSGTDYRDLVEGRLPRDDEGLPIPRLP